MIADIIHKIAADQQKEKGEYNYSERPSLSGPNRCIRQMVYWSLGYPRKPLPGRTVIIFDDSSWHEELTADWIRRSAYTLHSEQMHINIPAGLDWLPERSCGFKGCKEIIPAGHLGGHIDGILTDLVGKDILWEHKAINHFTFAMDEKVKVFPLDYITQTCLYLLGIQEVEPRLADALLCIKNKNTSQYFEYYISYDSKKDTARIEWAMSSTDCERITVNEAFENIAKNAFDKFKIVREYVTKKEIPPRQYDHSDWQCNYCPYGEICYENWEDEFATMEKDVVLDEEMETMCHYYLETNMHLKEMNKKKDELKSKIKARMKELNVKEGTAGGYIVRLRLQEKKEFVSPACKFEVLNIYNKKEKK